MSSDSDSPPVDDVLRPYLSAPSEAAARERLGELLAGIAAPLVWRVIRRQLGGPAGGIAEADLEDLHAGTLLRLQLHLVAVRAGETAPPASFPDYVAVSSYNACSALLMAREPERTRLRYRVRYVLRKHPGLASWTAATRETVCGLAAWSGRPAPAAGERLAAVAADQAAAVGRASARFARLVAAVLERYGEPCRVEALVDALAGALDVHDETSAPLPGGEAAGDALEPADRAPSAQTELEGRQALARLWAEIRELLPHQRAALLLNLRDEHGGDMLGALLGSGVADAPELAAALGLGTEELRILLPELPLEDLRIADRLGLTRQQVINLRKSARLRLARRLRGHLPGMGG